MKRISPYIKMKVLGAVEFAPGKNIQARVKAVSKMIFTDEEGHACQFTWRTISTWLYRYKSTGITGMQPQCRCDKGKTRKVTPEQLLEIIEQVLASFHGKSYNIAMIYRVLIERGLLRREHIAPNTFRRIVNKYELLKPYSKTSNKKRLAFSKQFANDMWQADTLFGPYVKNGATRTRTKLICFLDDASRVLCHGEFFFYDNVETLTRAFKSALYKRGVPESLYVDNGSNYASKEIAQICARIGCLLCHTPVRDGAAKGKIERFFRTVRETFLCRALDLSSLDTLNNAFTAWVENEYNAREHSVLGMKPIDRFGIDLSRIRFLPPNETNDELFFVEEDRAVRNDNTFSLKNIRFEAPRDLRNRKVQVRYNRQASDKKAFVYYKGERMGPASPVDFIGNDRHTKNKPQYNKRRTKP